MDHIALQINFKIDKFKLTGELPEGINAGNQFYGEDLSKWLCSNLKKWDLDYLDEDWGWYVFTRSNTNSKTSNEICVYAYPDKKQIDDYGNWMIFIHTSYEVPFLRFFKKMRKGEVNERLSNDLISLLEDNGANNITAYKCKMDVSGNIKEEIPYNWKTA